jgi:hypothetical protein
VNVKPAVAAEQMRELLQLAWEYQQEKCQEYAEEQNLPIDFTNLTEVVELFDPVRLVNEFHYISHLPLDNLQKQDPLKLFEGVVRILMVSDHYASQCSGCETSNLEDISMEHREKSAAPGAEPRPNHQRAERQARGKRAGRDLRGITKATQGNQNQGAP